MSTNPLGVIDRYYDDLNPTDRQVADYIRENPVDTSRFSIDVVANEVGVSKSTLVRFTQKIGFSGYAQFKHDLANFLLSHQTSEDDQPTSAIARITDTYAEYIRQMGNSLDDKDVDALAKLVCESDRILIAGYDRAYHSAAQLSSRLMNVAVRSQATSDLGMLHNSYDLYTEDDLLVLFTVADGTKRFATHVPAIKESSIKTACVTCSPMLPFKKLCDQYLVLPRISRDPDVMFLDDQAVFFVFIEALVDAIAKRQAARKV